jgi:pimeloyl-ACP methyl ester carboxylesterase
MTDGAIVRVRRYAHDNGPRLIASHGNGFAIDAYWPFLKQFAKRFELVVFDLRNHGQNPRHLLQNHRIDRFVSDFETILGTIRTRHGARPTVGIFHSISSITALLHAIRHGWQWDALVAVDPPLVPPPGHHLYTLAHAAELRLSDWASSRRERFETADEFAGILAKARTNAHWIADAPGLIANAVLQHDSADNDWSLVCPGAFEAQVYADNANLNLGPTLQTLAGPLMFACADPRAPKAWSPAKVNAALGQTHGHAYHAFEGTGHMLQLERPEQVSARIQTFFDDTGICPHSPSKTTGA